MKKIKQKYIEFLLVQIIEMKQFFLYFLGSFKYGLFVLQSFSQVNG